MTQAIQRAGPSRLALAMWGAERLQVLKEQIAPGASDAELDLFATVCRRTRLDPFAKQIWSISRRVQVDGQWQTRQVIQIGVHGLRLTAARTREYLGQVGPFWCGPDGQWADVWIRPENPSAAKVGVRRKGFAEPIWSVAVWDRAVQSDRNGNPQALWKTRGPEQLALAAERDALRRAFPIETADVEVLVDEDAVAAHSARYGEIFGDEERGTVYDLPETRVRNGRGDVVDATTGEVLEDSASLQARQGRSGTDSPPDPERRSPAHVCVTCQQPILDQSGKPINDNQRQLLLQRYGTLECRSCRDL